MNEQFYELPEEKRLRIINAALEVFSQNEYKRAVTDEIAQKAGISKGLLFYYFHNKKSLYTFLCEYGTKLILEQVMDDQFLNITDFFELICYAAEKKVRLFEKTPYLADFMVRYFYGFQAEGESPEPDIFSKYFDRADFSKFREEADPREIYDMLVWMTEGYIHDKRRRGEKLDMEVLMGFFHGWVNRLRRIAYKEAYQEEG